ncbi:uncharacterized protein PV06_06224 [Exophiala oligosperma]|uniref:DUF3074 domain-containing protein n=2 Tax=Chaetothyriales TaxID=34395 RepID=A0A0D2DI64_9EURO|nr:uncharacterized protein PV06_06224 [Exophiala oligosperma]KAJ9617825.1 hypothetical protein H2204_013408 [Knufia peltigerae]KIW42703.1 hypothetical protein PV06_06224 [Exophiala oligosperma]
MAGESSSSSPRLFSPSNLIRLAPLQASDLPSHPDLPGSSAEVLPFLTALLEDGASFLSPSNFQETFKNQSTKTSPPSAAKVEILTCSIPATSISQVQWTGTSSAQGAGAAVSRSKPQKIEGEHWFARRSVHADVSSKSAGKPGHANWDEFVFGIRDEHSKHEMEFTPTLYDARKVADWAGQINKLDGEGRVHNKYDNLTMGVYEMCHTIPAPLMPRCFCVLVVTASTGDGDEIVAVTVPVDLASANRTGITTTAAAAEKNKNVGFYSSMRNVREGEDAQRKKVVVMGAYTAVEVVRRHRETQEIEWIMATASDARGNLPMWMQKLGIPGAIAKDVGYFLKWIKDVDEKEILQSSA